MIVVEAESVEPERVAGSHECTIVFANGETRGAAAGSLLLADYAVMSPSSALHIDSPAAWAGVIWRVGRDAVHLLTTSTTRFDASEALDAQLIDAIAENAALLFDSRSAMALDSAATLISWQGGDALERAEFARLFAVGEPQRGLAAFLGKRRPRF